MSDKEKGAKVWETNLDKSFIDSIKKFYFLIGMNVGILLATSVFWLWGLVS